MIWHIEIIWFKIEIIILYIMRKYFRMVNLLNFAAAVPELGTPGLKFWESRKQSCLFFTSPWNEQGPQALLLGLCSLFCFAYTRLKLSRNAGRLYKQVQNRLHFFSGLTESGCHDIEKTTTNSLVVQLILLAPSCGRKK